MIDMENSSKFVESPQELWYDPEFLGLLRQLERFCDKRSNNTLARVARAEGMDDLVPLMKEVGIAHMKARYIPWTVYPYCVIPDKDPGFKEGADSPSTCWGRASAGLPVRSTRKRYGANIWGDD